MLFIILVLLRFFTAFSGLYGQDAYEYARFADRIYGFISTGAAPGDYFWPVLYPVSGAILNIIIRDLAFALQMISIGAFCLTFYFLNKILLNFYPDHHNRILVFTGITFLLSPIALRSAFLVMSDMLALMLVTGAIYNSIKYYKQRSVLYLIAAAFFTTAAVMTRYPAGVVLVIPAAVVGFTFIKNINLKAVPIVILVILIVLLPHFLIRWKAPFDFAGHEFLEDWSFLNFFKSSYINNSGHFNYPFFNLLHAFFTFLHPGFVFFGILLLPFIKKRDLNRSKQLFILLPVALYTLFIAGLPYQNIRYLLLIFPLVLVLYYSAFCRALIFISSKRISLALVLTGIVILQIALFIPAIQPFYSMNKVEQNIAYALKEFPQQNIISFGMDVPLQYYLKERSVMNISEVDRQLDYTNHLLLLNDAAFAGQLQNTIWEEKEQYLKESYDLIELKSFDNWHLYELKIKK